MGPGRGARSWRKPPRAGLFPVPPLIALCLLAAILRSSGKPTSADSPADAPSAVEGHPSQAFAMTFMAGSSTGIGALLVLCVTRLSARLLAVTMAFSAGVMMYVSLVAVVHESYEHFRRDHSEPRAYAFATLSFFVGAVVMALTDDLVHMLFDALVHDGKRRGRRGADGPRRPNHLELGAADSADESDEERAAIESVFSSNKGDVLVMSAVLGIAIALHNLPEGMATYCASYQSVGTGAPLTLAIAIHNIPEGLAVAMPIFHATGSRSKAIFWASLSGMAEPLGALLAYAFVNPRTSQSAFGALFALSAGMMVYVCLSELLPAAYREHPSTRLITQAFFAGCCVMASSLVLEKFNEG